MFKDNFLWGSASAAYWCYNKLLDTDVSFSIKY